MSPCLYVAGVAEANTRIVLTWRYVLQHQRLCPKRMPTDVLQSLPNPPSVEQASLFEAEQAHAPPLYPAAAHMGTPGMATCSWEPNTPHYEYPRLEPLRTSASGPEARLPEPRSSPRAAWRPQEPRTQRPQSALPRAEGRAECPEFVRPSVKLFPKAPPQRPPVNLAVSQAPAQPATGSCSVPPKPAHLHAGLPWTAPAEPKTSVPLGLSLSQTEPRADSAYCMGVDGPRDHPSGGPWPHMEFWVVGGSRISRHVMLSEPSLCSSHVCWQ